MSLLDLFKKPIPLTLQHAELGLLTFDRRLRSWERSNLTFWGFSGVDLVLDAPEIGPSNQQVSEYHRLADMQGELLPKFIAALKDLEDVGSAFILTSFHIPKLDGTETGELANFWFDRAGDENFMYGLQSIDRWRTFSAHRDD